MRRRSLFQSLGDGLVKVLPPAVDVNILVSQEDHELVTAPQGLGHIDLSAR